jgi:hypothetical protein
VSVWCDRAAAAGFEAEPDDAALVEQVAAYLAADAWVHGNIVGCIAWRYRSNA